MAVKKRKTKRHQQNVWDGKHSEFTTTGNKSEQSFDALTVAEGGRGMEMEKDFFFFKKGEWSFSCESSEGQILR